MTKVDGINKIGSVFFVYTGTDCTDIQEFKQPMSSCRSVNAVPVYLLLTLYFVYDCNFWYNIDKGIFYL
jgi:hypothetical protein